MWSAILTIVVLIAEFHTLSCNVFSQAWTRAIRLAVREQSVEDINSLYKFDDHIVRRLIVLPLTDAFNPNQANPMFGKVQYGDKCSMPSSIGRKILEKPYEVPWLFEIKRVSNNIINNDGNIAEGGMTSLEINDELPHKVLDKAYISPLDFRSPENYIFVPQWLMKSMGLKDNDLVDVSFVRIKLAGLVVLQPLSLEWDKLIERTNRNPKTILEHEVNKYSSLTAGSTIAIEVEGIEYPFFVKDTKSEIGVSVKGVRIQDSDVKVDFDRKYLDTLIKNKNKTAKKASNN